MPNIQSVNEVSLLWKRPPGPLNVWKTVESTKKFKNGQPIKYIIQDIPKDRYQDALDHMCKFFLQDEPCCNSLNVLSDKQCVKEFRDFWLIILEQGIVVGAFVEDPDAEKPILAGLNMVFIITKEDEATLEKISDVCKSEKEKTLFYMMMKLASGCDVKSIYQVDKYMSAFGLSVDPEYRGEKLGQVLLSTRNDIGRKYGITATETVFSAGASQCLAERVGFKVGVEVDCSTFLDKDGSVAFPLLAGETLKVMHMKLE